MKVPSIPWKWILLLVGVGIVVAALYSVYRDGFQTSEYIVGDASGNMMQECLARETCSDCLTPEREISPPEDSSKTPRQRCLDAGGTYNESNGSCEKRAVCGWCRSAQKCVPRVGSATYTENGVQKTSAYPVVPRKPVVAGAAPRPTDEPQFACSLRDFTTKLEDCSDFQCGSIKNCRDCSMSAKCGWCVASNTCLKKDGTAPAADAGGVCNANADDFVTQSGKCPWVPCSSYTDCEDCAKASGCAYCVQSSRCLQISTYDPQTLCTYKRGTYQQTADKSAWECRASDNTLIDLTQSLEQCVGTEGQRTTTYNPITSPFQCPSQQGGGGITSRSESSTYLPSSGQLASIQSNELGGATDLATQTIFGNDLSGAVTPPRTTTVVGGPGVVKRVGTTSRGIVYPDPTQGDHPFEDYIQMLVRSELAGQGVPLNEPFQVAELGTSKGGAKGPEIQRIVN